MLSELNLKDNYSSDDSNILNEFVKPCLMNSKEYFRSVGYLDSKVLALLGEEFESFSNIGGECRLLIGKTISPEDYLAIKEGALNPERFLEFPDLSILWNEIDKNDVQKKGLLILSWLVAKGVIRIKYSLRPNGIHHDKFAYFRDHDRSEIVAHGTNNDTRNANLPEYNYESLSVFKSWDVDVYKRFGEYKLAEFLRLWSGNSKNSISVDAPDPVLEKISCLSEDKIHDNEFRELFFELKKNIEKGKNLPDIPLFFGSTRFELKRHQEKAIKNYFSSDYKGIFALATGSGKTITAIYAATLLSKQIALDNNIDILVLVSVPYQILADQWVDNLRIFGYEPIKAYGSINNWFEPIKMKLNLNAFDSTARITSIVSVNKTLQSNEFLNLISEYDSSQIIFIGDECHRLGNIVHNKKTPKADYKIGLSATPWGEKEIQLKERLISYFGKPISYYGLSDAFRDDVLVKYEYYFDIVELNEDEAELYENHSNEARKLQAIQLNGGVINESALAYHLNMRAAVLGSANEKFELLPNILERIKEKTGLKHLLVYCGSGTTDDSDISDMSLRDIERAQIIANKKNNLQSARITAKESQSARNSILGSFSAGTIDSVFAIKVLDEGFDMPGIKSALLLASSRNERQFIQRRGRVLRKNKGKDKAYIWDIIVTSKRSLSEGTSKELTEYELLRALEFARLALNWKDLEKQLQDLADENNVDYDEIFNRVKSLRYEVEDCE